MAIAQSARQLQNEKAHESKMKVSQALENEWRRGWDSNPRRPLSLSGFRDRCTNPLCDLSGPYSVRLRRKKSCMSARHSSSSTPSSTSMR